ncbi:MAG TPA: hypothetical protein VHU87_06450 [Rhizomicrobium sp.]|jgi:hypothetical protein|nr:hypothetical protein [Rhizomicrobium sp.]
MGWTARIVISVIVILLVGAAVLGFYESTRPPQMHDVDETVPITSNP